MNHSKAKTFLAAVVTGVCAWLPALSIHAETNPFAPGTLAEHLATNAVGRAVPFVGHAPDMVEIHAPFTIDVNRFFRPEWSQSFWLKGVQGLSATCIGFSNINNGQGLVTMVSPRHYLCATHMHPESYLIGFLDTNNTLHWRRTLERANVGVDTTVGILDADLPPSVGFLPVLPSDYIRYLPKTNGTFVQGIGMNQNMMLFSQPTILSDVTYVTWNSHTAAPGGLGTNWNVTIRGGDSSNPARLLIGNQLVLISHNSQFDGGPSYVYQTPAINRVMHQLSTNHLARTDYQLTVFPLTNWPALR